MLVYYSNMTNHDLEYIKSLLKPNRLYYYVWDPQGYYPKCITDDLEEAVKHTYVGTMKEYRKYMETYKSQPKGLECGLSAEQLMQHIECELQYFKSENDEETFWEYLDESMDSIYHASAMDDMNRLEEEQERKWIQTDIKKYKSSSPN